jgi:hypothetical protein
MSFEDRFRSTVDQALGPIVRQLLDQAGEEREQAVSAARAQALAVAEQSALARISEAEERVKSRLEQTFAAARVEDRETAAREIRREIEAELEPKIADAVASTETRLRVMLAETQVRAAEDLKAAVADARVKQREIEMAGVTRLLESVRGLDGATTLSEVLDALALAAARESARAAVVVVRGERISGWKMSGFGPRDAQPKSIDLPLAESGVISIAASAARAVTTRDSQTAVIGPGFDQLPADRMGLAVPVIVGGRVVAVVYADAVAVDVQGQPVPGSWPELIEVLARHAGRCLEALTVQRTQGPKVTPVQGTSATAPLAPQPGPSAATQLSAMMQITDGVAAAARRTARLLVAEIRLFHEPAVDEGRRDRNLLSRLAPEIEKARQAYNEQVPAVVRGQADFFHLELIRTLAGGDPSLLGNLV